MNLQEVGCGDIHLIGLTQDSDTWQALVNEGWEGGPSGSIQCGFVALFTNVPTYSS